MEVINLNPQGNTGSWTKDILPVAILGALAIGAYYLVKSGILGNLGNTVKSAVSTVTQTVQSGSAAVSQGTQTFSSAINTAGEYANPQESGSTIFSGYGIGSLFVNTGAGFDTDLFPLGDVNTVNAPITTQEQTIVIKNECNEPYGGWWDLVPGLCASVAGG
jgi:hypothetical protein